MGMVVRTNTMAINAYRQLGMNNSAVAKSLEKLASGYRINRAGDDAAGLAISEKMKAQITGLETASSNAQDGISLIQTAEGNLSEVHDMLNRMVELATKSANGTYTQTERDALQSEVDQLLDEVDRISQSANFNGAKLLDGTIGMNSEAFKLGEFGAVDGKPADPGEAVAIKDANFGNTDGTDLHVGTKGSAEQKPAFSVNFADYTATIGAGSKANDTIKIDSISVAVGGADKNIQVANAGGTAWEDFAVESAATTADDEVLSLTGEDVADALRTAGTVNIDGLAYTVGGSGTDVTFTYAGKAEADSTVTADEPIAGDVVFTGDLKLATAANAGTLAAAPTVSGRHDCPVYDVTNGKKGEAGKRAGITFALDEDIVAAGNTLTIDGKSFSFVEWDGKSDLAAGQIGLKSTLSGDDLLKDVAIQMATTGNRETDNFLIGIADDGKSIEIEEKVNDDGVYGGYTAADMKKLFSASSGATEATGAGTELTITSKNIAVGDKLKVGDKVYTFGDGANDIKIGDNTVADLKKALEDDGFTVSDDGNKLTISAAADKPPVLIGGDGLTLQIGDTADSFNKMTVGVPNMGTLGLGLDGLVITNQVAASNAIDTIKTAINSVSTARADMGALQNRLEHTINNLDVAAENLSAANSRIRDTDMAKEMMNYTKMNVLVQSAQAMLAQANQQPQSVLQLLQ